MLTALFERRPIEEPVALVVAHPDDETLAVGGSLHLFRRLLLIHVTDGAPRLLNDAAREGFDSPAGYAAARASELDAALALVESETGAEIERMRFDVADQSATASIAEITARLSQAFADHGIESALTHCYEGGHPDHDAVAMAVQLSGAAEIMEFAGYHADADGLLRTGEFLARHGARGADETTIQLHGNDLTRKRAMLACFGTQRDILGRFDASVERFRRAPRYDFSHPPHAGRLLYEEWGWMSGEAWRDLARCNA